MNGEQPKNHASPTLPSHDHLLPRHSPSTVSRSLLTIHRPLTPVLYALTIFLSAFLLFLVQPMIGKYILPWFGGGPGVWTTCLLFFQTLLLGGYGYAHLITTRLRPRAQAVTHLLLLLFCLAWLPIIPSTAWKPGAADEPTLRILLLLTATLGLPYLLLSATGPLLQRWFSLSHPGTSPYRLYALSNVGSLLALLGFPFAIEPAFARATQAWGWSVLFVVFVLLCGVCAWRIRQLSLPAPSDVSPDVPEKEAETADAPTLGQRALWLGYPAVASVLLVATTSKLCVDVAIIPFLWVLPLTLYLLSFILCFDHPRWYRRTWFTALFVPAAVAIVYHVSLGLHAPMLQQLIVYNGALFVACMICHGEAYLLRPAPRHLTRFYLHLSAGGALGGFFVAVVAPLIFKDYFELHLGYWLLALILALVCLTQKIRAIALGLSLGTVVGVVLLPWFFFKKSAEAGLWGQIRDYLGTYHAVYSDYRWWAAAVLLLTAWTLREILRPGAREWRRNLALLPLALTALLGTVFGLLIADSGDELVASARNFYGTLKVRPYGDAGTDSESLMLSHGITTHGMQFARPAYRGWPTTYYGEKSGIGLALNLAKPGSEGRHFGFVGLGAGTLASYGKKGDHLRFYEINPAVLRLARENFSFLSDTAGELKIVLGDARLSLENELAHDAPQAFDVLALDAFSSDAIPIHLLTREAMDLYLQHLKPGGVIAVHISNRHLDLRPVVEAHAKDLGLHLATISHNPQPNEWWLYRSTWVLLSRDATVLAQKEFQDAADATTDDMADLVRWTDDRASLLGVFR